MSKASESTDLGINVSLTKTDLSKGYTDLSPQAQELLRNAGVHDFEAQELGSKVDREAILADSGGSLTIRFLRPRTKNGTWKRLSLRKNLVEALELVPGSNLVFTVREEKLYLAHSDHIQCMKENDVIRALTEYGYGGKSAAVVPGEKTLAEKTLPEGDLPPGAIPGRDFLEEALKGDCLMPRWLFLVGGPGNGKSWISRSIEENHGLLRDHGETDTLARRDYRYRFDETRLVILNDATITLEDGQERNLIDDLVEHSASGTNLVANLNRGAIIEDLHKAQGSGSAWAEDLLHWLLEDGKQSAELVSEGSEVNVEDGGFPGSTQGFRLTVDHNEIEVVVAFLDKHSLLESGTPLKKVGDAGSLKRLETSAGKLTLELVSQSLFEDSEEGCAGCEAASKCPFLANAKSLRAGKGRMVAGLSDLLRAAEIASGSPFTYREIWSILSQAILGRWRSSWKEQHPCHWVHEQKDHEELHRQRIHRSLFPRWEEWCGNRSDDIPAQDYLDAMDPGLDSSDSWARVASEAVQGTRFGVMPYHYVSEVAAEGSDNHAAGLHEAISELDLLVDHDRFKGLLDPEEDQENVGDAILASDLRRPGIELVRLLGLWNGRPASSMVFNQWIYAHNLKNGIALKQAKAISAFPLAKGLLRLILPPTEIQQPGQQGASSGECLLPVFEPRTEPLVFPVDSSVVCLSADPADIQVKLESRGDRLMLILGQSGSSREARPAEMDLDFWTCREALVLVDQPGGFTERGFGSAPRLERFRAAICAGLEKTSPTIEIAGHKRNGIAFINPSS